jgi:hypothetical protein
LLENLQRNVSLKRYLFGQIHIGHASAPQASNDGIVTDAFTGQVLAADFGFGRIAIHNLNGERAKTGKPTWDKTRGEPILVFNPVDNFLKYPSEVLIRQQ